MPVTALLPGRTVVIEGKERLYFSGTSYLGISKNTAFQQVLLEGMQYYGTSYSSSRSSNLELAIYQEAENLLASLTGAEAALTFSSGYLAGQATINTLHQEQTFIYAPETHPAMWRNRYDSWHGSYNAWIADLPQHMTEVQKKVVVVSNSLNPLLAEKYSFDWISHLPDDKQITLLIDDSHGLGVTGKNGTGIFPELKAQFKPNIDLVVVSSLGKAYGIPGGVVLGKTDLIEVLKKNPFFTAGSPISPAYLYAFTHAQNVYEQARKQLLSNVNYFKQLVKPIHFFQYFDDYPVFYTKENQLYEALKENCILSSFPYPDPESKPITRAVISSLHVPADLEYLAQQIIAYSKHKGY